MKHTLNKIMLALLISSFAIALQAQTYSLKDVRRSYLKSSGTIVEGNIVKGYFFFYASEKVDRKNWRYEIVILDADLNEVTAKTIREPKTTYLLESSYNGANILFKFYDKKAKTISYRTLEQNGTLSSKETRPANKYELVAYVNSVAKDLNNTNLNSVDGNLFIDIYGIKSKKYKYEIQGLDNKGNIEWTYAPADRKGVTGGMFLAASKSELLLLQSESKNLFSKDFTFKLISLSKQGELNYDMDLANKRYNMLPISAVVNVDQGFTVMGEYYNIKDKSFKSESLGIFIKIIGKNGSEESETFLSWSRDIGSKMPSEYKRSLKSFSVFFHNIFVTEDGEIIAIGEQYRKQVSAGGIALKALAAAAGGESNASALEILIGHMVMIRIDSDLEVDEVQVWEKSPSRVILTEGYGIVNRHLLARVIKAEGSFDYAYTQNNEDNSLTTVAFLDREKEKGKLSKQAIFRFVNFKSGEDGVTEDKLDLETDATQIITLPAKPGHVLIVEYFRKKKVIDIRLEPLNF